MHKTYEEFMHGCGARVYHNYQGTLYNASTRSPHKCSDYTGPIPLDGRPHFESLTSGPVPNQKATVVPISAYPVLEPNQSSGTIRTFDTGATRDADTNKYDYEGFLSPVVLERFGKYMHVHRRQSDGSLRASDNWQKGIPREAYMKSLLRHVMDVWKIHRGGTATDPTNGKEITLQDALMGVLFNAQGYAYEDIKENGSD